MSQQTLILHLGGIANLFTVFGNLLIQTNIIDQKSILIQLFHGFQLMILNVVLQIFIPNLQTHLNLRKMRSKILTSRVFFLIDINMYFIIFNLVCRFHGNFATLSPNNNSKSVDNYWSLSHPYFILITILVWLKTLDLIVRICILLKTNS